MDRITIYWLVAVIVGVVSAASNDLIVQTLNGPIKGYHVKSYEGRIVTAFEGIPYAKPPVGELRFQKAQPIQPWNKTLIANKKYTCIQYIAYLDDGGIAGFLSTQDEVIPGNNGLKDQIYAMKWVKDNIENFGGNPYSITLVGHSAGGASVHLHYVSPLSAGLFSRGISHSGTALNTIFLAKTPLKNARKLGAHLNCSTSSSTDLVDCLRNKSINDVVSAHRHFFSFISILPFLTFGPVIEFGNPSAFLPGHPYELIMEGRINDCPWVVSTTKDEGIVPTGLILVRNQLQELEERWEELAPIILEFNDTTNDVDKIPISKAIKMYYLGNESISRKNIRDLIRLFTDRLFYVDAIKAASLQAKVQVFPVYYYLFEYYIDIPVLYKGNISVVGHGDDTRLLYRHADNPPVLSGSDRKMKDILIDFLYSFANKSIPTFNGRHWLPFHSSSDPTHYMHIFSPDTIRPERAVNTESFDFWQQLPLWENERVIPYLENVAPTSQLYV